MWITKIFFTSTSLQERMFQQFSCRCPLCMDEDTLNVKRNNSPSGSMQKHRSKKLLAVSDKLSGTGGEVVVVAMLYITVKLFVNAGQGCLADAISITVDPTLQISALNPCPVCLITIAYNIRATEQHLNGGPTFRSHPWN